jgi:hypothetical protein
MIRHLILFANGNVAATDANGQQLPEFNRALFSDYLKNLQRLGAIDNDTKVSTPIRDGAPISDWLR